MPIFVDAIEALTRVIQLYIFELFKMDKKRNRSGTTINPRMVQGTTLREENIGKKRVDMSSMLRMEHLQKLATWASVEAGIPPLGALFGYRLAATAEAEAVPLDPSTFACQRCESILQPGFNCTVRIEKIARKAKPRKKSHISPQNNVVYKCNFCSHPNLMRGTQQGYVKELLASRQRLVTDPNVQCSSMTITNKSDTVGTDPNVQCSLKTITNKSDTIGTDPNVQCSLKTITNKSDTVGTDPNVQCSLKTVTNKSDRVLEDNEKLGQDVGNEISLDKSPLTPLLERLTNSSKRKRKKSRSNNVNSCVTLNSIEGTGGGRGSTKRKRKGWSSLKDIAECNESRSSRNISNFAIPFLLQAGK